MALGFPIQNGSTSHVAVASQIAIRTTPRTSCAATLLRKGISVEGTTVMIRLLAELRNRTRGRKGPVPPKCQCKPHAIRRGASLRMLHCKHDQALPNRGVAYVNATAPNKE